MVFQLENNEQINFCNFDKLYSNKHFIRIPKITFATLCENLFFSFLQKNSG